MRMTRRILAVLIPVIGVLPLAACASTDNSPPPAQGADTTPAPDQERIREVIRERPR